MKTRHSFYLFLVLSVFSGLLLAGCGDGGQTPPAPSQSTNAPAAPATNAPGK